MTDGKDDLELDGYYVDDPTSTIYLFQSKFRSTPGNVNRKDLITFTDVPKSLTSGRVLAGNTNEKILEFAPLFRERIVDGYELRLIFLTTSIAHANIHARAQEWGEEPLLLEVGGDRVDVPHSIVVSDIEDLLRAVDSLSKPSNIVVDLKLVGRKWHLSPAGQFRCLVATISADELAKTFDTYKYAIFRHNPRGPLGSVGVNKDIKATLKDPSKRTWFHLMNNGLSAVCDAFTNPKETDGGHVITIHDLQIVNGCQTTYSIWDYWRRAGSLGDTQVILKLVEGAKLHDIISRASNTQSQMKDWDFLFDDETQKRLQNSFQKLTPPIFYELRRGEYKYMVDTNAERVTVKNVAQAVWAFNGSPGEAKDKLRDIPRSRGNKSGAYYQVFFKDVEAEWLLLPWLVYKKVQKEWENYSRTSERRGDLREHGRLTLVWLVGRGLTKALGIGSYHDVSPNVVAQLILNIDEWFPPLHLVAVDTITSVVRIEKKAAEKTGQTMNIKQLFRSSASYPDLEEEHDNLLSPVLNALKEQVLVR